MKAKHLLLFGLACLLSCKQSPGQGSAEASASKYEYKTVVRSLSGCNPKNPPCAYSQVTYPVFAGSNAQALNNLITNGIILDYEEHEMDSYQSIEDQLSAFVADFAGMMQLEPELAKTPWYADSELKVQHLDENLMVVWEDEVFFTGGAHENHLRRHYNIDLQTPKILRPEDLFAPGFEAGLDRLLEMQFRASNGLAPDESLMEKGGLYQDYILHTNNFQLFPDRICFYYNEHEIGPPSMGPVDICLTRTFMETEAPGIVKR